MVRFWQFSGAVPDRTLPPQRAPPLYDLGYERAHSPPLSERHQMERRKASDFPQELLNLFDGYVHGGISRRQFLDRAQKFAVGSVTAAALFEMLKPNYAWA